MQVIRTFSKEGKFGDIKLFAIAIIVVCDIFEMGVKVHWVGSILSEMKIH